MIGRDQIPFTWMHSTSIMSLPAVMNVKGWSDIPPCPEQALRHAASRRNASASAGARKNHEPAAVEVAAVGSGTSQIIATRADTSRARNGYSLSPEKADLYSESEFRQPVRTQYEPDRMTDWAATRDYILSMDFVVTVDTAVAPT